MNCGLCGQIDLTELLQGSEVVTGDPRTAACVWRDACFTLKYYSDALFDFPHWFGFSKRAFKVNLFHFLLPFESTRWVLFDFVFFSIEAENDAGQKYLKRNRSSPAFFVLFLRISASSRWFPNLWMNLWLTLTLQMKNQNQDHLYRAVGVGELDREQNSEEFASRFFF